MPATIHPFLLTGLCYKPIDDWEDQRSNSRLDCDQEADRRAAKRQRVEHIASEYLLGKTPFILSATLKGPFGGDWENPWIERSTSTRAITENSETVIQNSHDISVARTDTTKARRTRNRTKKRLAHKSAQSAKNSREADNIHSAQKYRNRQRQETSPRSGRTDFHEQDATGALDVSRHVRDDDFSMLSERTTKLDMPSVENERWLKRSTTNRGTTPIELMEQDTSNDPDTPSGRPTASKHVHIAGRRSAAAVARDRVPITSTQVISHPGPHNLSITQDKLPGHSNSFTPINVPVQEANQPTRGEHISITSTDHGAGAGASQRSAGTSNGFLHIGGTTTTFGYTDSVDMSGYVSAQKLLSKSARHVLKSLQDRNSSNVQEVFVSTETYEFKDSNVKPRRSRNALLQDSHVSILNGYHGAKKLSIQAADRAFGNQRLRHSPSTTEVDITAEKCVASNSELADGRNITTKRWGAGQYHLQIASPVPRSSGFVYKKVSDTQKHEKKLSAKRKPRLVTFESSLTTLEDGGGQTGGIREGQDTETVETRSSEALCKAHTDLVDSDGKEEGASLEFDALPETHDKTDLDQLRFSNDENRYTEEHSTRDLSTQTAMMLAQMEFQEGDTTAHEPLDVSRCININTPAQYSSSAPLNTIRSFQAFNSEPKKDHYGSPSQAAIPMSTQDLFTAASPFAFSTIKKKTARSNTPNRIPLKERNDVIKLSDRAFDVQGKSPNLQNPIFETTPQAGMNCTLHENEQSVLDDVDVTEELEFARRYLRNWDGTGR